MAGLLHLPFLELHCFGASAAIVKGVPAPPEVQGRKHLALLVYLALSPRRRRERAHLLGLLWPNKPESYSRHSLNEAVRRLRTHLGAQRLVSEGDSIAIDATNLEVDALQFDALVVREPTRAIQLLRGDFLEGFALDDAPAFEEWAASERARYRARAAGAFLAIGEDALSAARWSDALEAARRALMFEPYDELAARLQIRAAALSGDVAGSLAAFNEFAARIGAELGEHPSRELKALADRIRAGRWRRAAPKRPVEEPPLVGREAVYREAFAVLAAGVEQGPRTLLISGDPGTGKSRLLTDCVDRLALDGAVVARVRPLESDQDAPRSTLRSLLRTGLLRAPGSAGTDPASRARLIALDEQGLRSPVDAAELAGALAALLHAIAEEQPVALAVDDAHYADGLSLEALGAAVEQVHDLPVVLVLATLDRSDELPRALLRLRGDIGRTLPGAAVRLGPLSEAETRELVVSLCPWCTERDERDRLTRRVYFETGGNPFLLVTLLRALETASALREDVLSWPQPGMTIESPLPISMPNLARRAIVARVAELDEESRQVLRSASIGGSGIDLDLVSALTGLARTRVEDRLALLERHRLVTCDGVRYVFVAPLVAQVVRGECLPPGQRRNLQQRAIAVLAPRTDLESRLLRAELLAKTETGRVAYEAAVAAATSAISAGKIRSARRALRIAERTVPADDERARRALEQLRAALPS